MSTNDRAAFDAIMKGILQPYEAEAKPWKPNDEDYPEFAKAVMDRIDILPVRVSESLFAEYVRQIDVQLRRTTSPEIRADLERAKQRIDLDEMNPATGKPYPILPFAAALSAFEKLTLYIDDGIPTSTSYLTQGSPRFDAIIALVENIAEDAWQGKVIDTHIFELTELLYDAEHSINVTVDREKAEILANRIVDSVYEARGIFTGHLVEPNLVEPEPAPAPIVQVPASRDQNATVKMPMKPIQQFGERVLDQLTTVRFPVTEELFQRHINDAQAELDDTGDETLKYELERQLIGGKPSLHFLQAISALDSILQKDNPNAADEASARFTDIEGATMFLARQIWLNEDTTLITGVLKQLLHDPSERHNVTLDTDWATKVVRQIEKMARSVKVEMLGLSR
jgi:hypothetical protein